MDELLTVRLSDVPPPKKHTRWGHWHFLKRINVLQYRCRNAQGNTYMLYEIDLDEMRTSAQCLDWIFQVAFKTWMSDRDRTDLLRAIRERVNPQANLCSFGIEKGVNHVN